MNLFTVTSQQWWTNIPGLCTRRTRRVHSTASSGTSKCRLLGHQITDRLDGILRCLHLRLVSGGRYRLLRESGLIRLPSERMLCDYTHYIPPQTGFQDGVPEQLAREAKLDKIEWQKFVSGIWRNEDQRIDLQQVHWPVGGFCSPWWCEWPHFRVWACMSVTWLYSTEARPCYAYACSASLRHIHTVESAHYG